MIYMDNNEAPPKDYHANLLFTCQPMVVDVIMIYSRTCENDPNMISNNKHEGNGDSNNSERARPHVCNLIANYGLTMCLEANMDGKTM